MNRFRSNLCFLFFASLQGYDSTNSHGDNGCQGTEMKKLPRVTTNYNPQNDMKIYDQQSKLRSLSPDRTITIQHYEHGGGHIGGNGPGCPKTTLIDATPFPLQNSNSVNSVISQPQFICTGPAASNLNPVFSFLVNMQFWFLFFYFYFLTILLYDFFFSL
jgi:hypothetical protein